MKNDIVIDLRDSAARQRTAAPDGATLWVADMFDRAAAEIELLRGYRDEAEADASIARLVIDKMQLAKEERKAIKTAADAYADNDDDAECAYIAATLYKLLENAKPEKPD